MKKRIAYRPIRSFKQYFQLQLFWIVTELSLYVILLPLRYYQIFTGKNCPKKESKWLEGRISHNTHKSHNSNTNLRDNRMIKKQDFFSICNKAATWIIQPHTKKSFFRSGGQATCVLHVFGVLESESAIHLMPSRQVLPTTPYNPSWQVLLPTTIL